MTKREFLEAVKKANVSEELNTKADELLAALDKRNEAKTSKPSKTQIANEPIKAKILELLADGKSYLASEISAALGINEVSTAKANALASQLVAENKLTVADVKVKGKGSRKSYSIATVEETETTEE